MSESTLDRTVFGRKRLGTLSAPTRFGATDPGPPVGGMHVIVLFVEFGEEVEHAPIVCDVEGGNKLPKRLTSPGNQVPIEARTVRKIRDDTRPILAIFLAR